MCLWAGLESEIAVEYVRWVPSLHALGAEFEDLRVIVHTLACMSGIESEHVALCISVHHIFLEQI